MVLGEGLSLKAVLSLAPLRVTRGMAKGYSWAPPGVTRPIPHKEAELVLE